MGVRRISQSFKISDSLGHEAESVTQVSDAHSEKSQLVNSVGRQGMPVDYVDLS